MSQTGFPNGGILPDDTEDFAYSKLITTEEEIREIAAELKLDAYDPQFVGNDFGDTASTSIEGLATAAYTLAQYYIQQITYGGSDGPGTPENPVTINYSEGVKELFTKSLGGDADNGLLFQKYKTFSRRLDGVQNTFFNLGLKEDSFSWDSDGNLIISDTYVFTGLDDLGAAPTKQQLQSIPGLTGYLAKFLIGLAVGLPLVPLADLKGRLEFAKMLFFGFKSEERTIPFNLFRWAEIFGGNATNIGIIEPMAFNARFTPEELYRWNPELFWDAVKKGFIPFSALLNMENFICNSIAVGDGPVALLPNYGSVAADIGSNPNSWTFGGGGNYPRPFTSFSQRIVEATYTLGPFAKFGPISGRIANLSIVCDQTQYVDLGFVRQNWYDADRGNAQYDANGELEKWEWWDQCVKTKIPFAYAHLPEYPTLPIEVATASYIDGDDNKFSPDLGVAPEDYTLLLGVVLAAAALGAII